MTVEIVSGGGLAIMLVNPQLGENIGAAARIMLNFGLEDLRLVEPRDGWPNPAAAAMASGAGRVLDNAMVTADLRSSLPGIQYVFATTARRRDLNKPVTDAAAAMAEARLRTERGQRVGVIFGPERAGLENRDLAFANAVIEVPVNPQFRSINLAQCVALVCYEWMRSGAGRSKETHSGRMPADAAVKARFVELLVDDLEQAGYFWPPENSVGMQLNLRNLFMRMDLTAAEIRTLHGVRRSLVRSGGRNASETSEGDNGEPPHI